MQAEARHGPRRRPRQAHAPDHRHDAEAAGRGRRPRPHRPRARPAGARRRRRTRWSTSTTSPIWCSAHRRAPPPSGGSSISDERDRSCSTPAAASPRRCRSSATAPFYLLNSDSFWIEGARPNLDWLAVRLARRRHGRAAARRLDRARHRLSAAAAISAWTLPAGSSAAASARSCPSSMPAPPSFTRASSPVRRRRLLAEPPVRPGDRGRAPVRRAPGRPVAPRRHARGDRRGGTDHRRQRRLTAMARARRPRASSRFPPARRSCPRSPMRLLAGDLVADPDGRSAGARRRHHPPADAPRRPRVPRDCWSSGSAARRRSCRSSARSATSTRRITSSTRSASLAADRLRPAAGHLAALPRRLALTRLTLAWATALRAPSARPDAGRAAAHSGLGRRRRAARRRPRPPDRRHGDGRRGVGRARHARAGRPRRLFPAHARIPEDRHASNGRRTSPSAACVDPAARRDS